MVHDLIMIPAVNIIILLIINLFIAIVYFSVSKKKRNRYDSGEEKGSPPISLTPHITVVFQKDISTDEELIKEVADMYVSNRTYYYSGTTPPETNDPLLSEKYNESFIRYESIDFDALKKIDF